MLEANTSPQLCSRNEPTDPKCMVAPSVLLALSGIILSFIILWLSFDPPGLAVCREMLMTWRDAAGTGDSVSELAGEPNADDGAHPHDPGTAEMKAGACERDSFGANRYQP